MIRCEAVYKAWAGRAVLDGFSLEVRPGTVCALLGPSGCGKTTLLRCVAGLEPIDAGRIELAGAVVAESSSRGAGVRSRSVPPEARGVGMVFQDLALWPHMTALETVAFALAGGGGAREARRARARETLAAVGLPEGLDRRPDTLSGGERQRLAFARAIAPSPRTLLLDEPFTGLHPQVREDLAGLTRRWVRETPGRAVLLVTHLADEALALADHAAVMGAGRCEQSGPPEALLARPASESAAYLLGYSTCLPAARCADNGWVETPLGRLDCPEAASSDRCRLAFRPGDFAARPEGRYSGTVVDTGVKNGVPACRVRAGDALLWVTGGGPARPGDAIRFDLAGRPAVLPAEDKEARS